MPMTTALRTAEPSDIDDDLIVAIESGLMTLSEAIGAAYLTHNERSELRWEALE